MNGTSFIISRTFLNKIFQVGQQKTEIVMRFNGLHAPLRWLTHIEIFQGVPRWKLQVRNMRSPVVNLDKQQQWYPHQDVQLHQVTLCTYGWGLVRSSHTSHTRYWIICISTFNTMNEWETMSATGCGVAGTGWGRPGLEIMINNLSREEVVGNQQSLS